MGCKFSATDMVLPLFENRCFSCIYVCVLSDILSSYQGAKMSTRMTGCGSGFSSPSSTSLKSRSYSCRGRKVKVSRKIQMKFRVKQTNKLVSVILDINQRISSCDWY